ncbi:MAG: VapC toxin family PIN domain ribonuclease [Deltaproteobacteria bacterium]|nr:MAG: VapC toxin family PIN domain ribonuclease [Deltaproteobacteria bacterium]
MEIIADTNTFLAVVLCEPERDSIIKLTIGHELLAPKVLPFEIGNALSAMLKRKKITSDEMLSAWNATQKIPVDLRAVDITKALEISSNFNVYAYDAYFLVCALFLHAPLLTLDKKMNQIANVLGIQTMEASK